MQWQALLAGPKGTGKTFQTELSFKKMKAQPVIMSAGELESGVAGGPGYLIRKRYRAAADMSKVRGVMSCLMVNDLDAGLGRFEVRLGVLLDACHLVTAAAAVLVASSVGCIWLCITRNCFACKAVACILACACFAAHSVTSLIFTGNLWRQRDAHCYAQPHA